MNTAVDMAQFIAPKSDQLNSDDLIGGPLTITVTGVSANEGSPEQPISISFQGDDGKPYKPCKSMRRVMVAVWGADANKYVGRSMTLYRDPKVQFGGMQVGGIRISHMTHIDEAKTMALTASRANRKPFTVQPLAEAPASKPDAAQTWADGFKSQVAAAADLPTLENFVAGKAAKLAELQGKRPELHAECEEAIAARKAAFSPADDGGFQDDEPADTPPADRTGFIAGLEARIAAAETMEELDACLDDLKQVDGLDEDRVNELEVAVLNRRRVLRKSGQ